MGLLAGVVEDGELSGAAEDSEPSAVAEDWGLSAVPAGCGLSTFFIAPVRAVIMIWPKSNCGSLISPLIGT